MVAPGSPLGFARRGSRPGSPTRLVPCGLLSFVRMWSGRHDRPMTRRTLSKNKKARCHLWPTCRGHFRTGSSKSSPGRKGKRERERERQRETALGSLSLPLSLAPVFSAKPRLELVEGQLFRVLETPNDEPVEVPVRASGCDLCMCYKDTVDADKGHLQNQWVAKQPR